MSKKELLTMKKEALKLYDIFMQAYMMEASRGYRKDIRDCVESSYIRFMNINNKLPEEHRIKSAVTLSLSA